MLRSALLLLLAAGCDSGGPTANLATLIQLMLTPPAVDLVPGGTVQFQVEAALADGSVTANPAVSFSATGGSVSASGLYTAPSQSGSYLVIATAQGSSLADTSTVTVTSTPGANPPAPPAGNFSTVVGDDWRSYRSKQELRAKGYFWWWLDGQDVYQHVDLVPDPLFGQVARVTFPQTDDVGYAPKLRSMFGRDLDHIWYRFKMKWSPGWTSAGAYPAGHANSYKLAFWYWESGYEGRGQIELSNTDEYITGVQVRNAAGQWIRHNESLLPGSAPNFGRIGTEWSDGEWWEYVVHYRKTGQNSARQQYWRRRYTSRGQVAPGPWIYHGWDLSGAYTPRTSGIALGETKNKNNPSTMYIWWGPWEVVDGSQHPNPFGMPNN